MELPCPGDEVARARVALSCRRQADGSEPAQGACGRTVAADKLVTWRLRSSQCSLKQTDRWPDWPFQRQW